MQISSPTQLVLCIESARDRYGPGCWWRGHGDSSWQLVPGIFRDGKSVYEEEFHGRFMMQAQFLDKSAPPPQEEYLCRFYEQHAGLPTRLLDWTSSALVATWFACAHARSREMDGELWLVDPFSLNQQLAGKRTIFTYVSDVPAEIKPIFDAQAVAAPAAGRIAALLSKPGSQRMHVQSAAFTVHSTLSCVAGELKSLGVCESFVIPAAAKPRLLAFLGDVGIRLSTLFPEVENLAREIASQSYSAA